MSTPGAQELGAWRERYASAASAWTALRRRDQERTSAVLAAWAERYQTMRSPQGELVDLGRWRGGPRTLLAAIGLQNRELTAGLAWLLRPDGHHGLGSAMLSRLLARLGIAGATDDVPVVCEESRGDDGGSGLDPKTRADLVVYSSGWTTVFEAKTYAPEQDRQLDRVYHHWKREAAPRFLFLSRGAREPLSAGAILLNLPGGRGWAIGDRGGGACNSRRLVTGPRRGGRVRRRLSGVVPCARRGRLAGLGRRRSCPGRRSALGRGWTSAPLWPRRVPRGPGRTR